MSETWHYADQGRRLGPVSLKALRDALTAQPNARDVLVWRDGFPDWKRAGEVPELWSQPGPPPPPAAAHPAGQVPVPSHTRAASFGDLGSLWFSFKGRANRAKYWLVVIVNTAISTVAEKSLDATSSTGSDPSGVALLVLFVVFIANLVSILAISAKRLHDRNKSAWWLLVFVVLPLLLLGIGSLAAFMEANVAIVVVCLLAALAIMVWSFIELGCLRGTVGSNQYGEDPLAGKA